MAIFIENEMIEFDDLYLPKLGMISALARTKKHGLYVRVKFEIT